jgi:hypothetical protein
MKATALTAFSSALSGRNDAGSVVDRDMGELPADAFARALRLL